MRSTLVYDWPTRIFHWVFAGLFALSFIIAKTVDDEDVAFTYHMLSGLLLGGLVVWRIFWGMIGSKHARFSGFDLSLVRLKNYLWGIISGSKERWAGHNPASSWAAIIMLCLALGLAVTGYLMTTGHKETFEDLHEIMANTFLVVTLLHVAGVVLHTLRHRDSIALSMLDGKKEVLGADLSIPSARPIAAGFLLGLLLAGGILLFQNFDSQNRTLELLGQNLQLGESE